jgi:hypothetical protein
MYTITALGLTSLDQVIWAGHVRRMDWSRLPRKFLTSRVDAPRCRGVRMGTLLRARSHARAPGDRLQHRQTGRPCSSASRRAGLLGPWGAAAQDREEWRKLAARLPLAIYGLYVSYQEYIRVSLAGATYMRIYVRVRHQTGSVTAIAASVVAVRTTGAQTDRLPG